MAELTLTAAQLRREINARAALYAHEHRLLHELSPGTQPAVLFGRDEHGQHGNFRPETYAHICGDPEWARRLTKPHTASRRSVARKDWRWMELDAAVSSDALLMNVFCHPGVFDGTRLPPTVATLLGVPSATRPCFGIHPGVPLAPRQRTTPKRRAAGRTTEPVGAVDRTEIDLVLGSLFVEAKLTEADFQNAAPALLERYRDLEIVFDAALLPRKMIAPPPLAPNIDPDDPTVNLPRQTTRTTVAGYQLIRNVLAAYAADASFCVLLDARRRDLIEIWYAILTAVHAPDFRWRLKLLTWQELAGAVPPDLQQFLASRYGIEPA
jgi:hypothetical protein